MDRLFIFAVGGTGARVMRSLTMLMSAGELSDYEVVPLLVDYDLNNGNLVQTLELMRMYKTIHDESNNVGTSMYNESFFGSPLTPISSITTPYDLAVGNGNDSFLFDLPIQYNHMRVCDLLDYHFLQESDFPFRLMLDSLFTTGFDGELNQDLCVGFKGNAKMARLGYAAMKIRDSIEFQIFLNNVVPNRDKVVIVGSTFGGTGSAGMLEILKQINYNHHFLIDNIATVLIEPYFLPAPNPALGVVDYGSTFKKCSQDFLKYYYESGFANTVKATYRIGMDGFVVFDNIVGGHEQKNVAHTVELLSAMAICEYAVMGQQGKIDYCLGHNILPYANERIGQNDFFQLPCGMRLFKLLTIFFLSAKLFKEHFWSNDRITNSHFYREMQQRILLEHSLQNTLGRLFSEFLYWMDELSNDINNKCRLYLYDMHSSMDDAVIGHPYNQNRDGFFANLFRRDMIRDYIEHMEEYYHSNRHENRFNNMSSEQIIIKLLSESSRRIYQNFNI